MMTRDYDLIDISDRSAWSVHFLGDRCMPGQGIIERSQKDLDALADNEVHLRRDSPRRDL
jgi:hypothetical protein